MYENIRGTVDWAKQNNPFAFWPYSWICLVDCILIVLTDASNDWYSILGSGWDTSAASIFGSGKDTSTASLHGSCKNTSTASVLGSVKETSTASVLGSG